MKQAGLFGLSDHLNRLSAHSDPLEVLARVVDFEAFLEVPSCCRRPKQCASRPAATPESCGWRERWLTLAGAETIARIHVAEALSYRRQPARACVADSSATSFRLQPENQKNGPGCNV